MGRSRRSTIKRTPATYNSSLTTSTARRESGGFLANIYGGFTSGLGFGVAQRAVESIFGPRQIETVHTTATESNRAGDKCQVYLNELQQCTLNNRDISLCQPIVESLRMCQNKNSF